MIPQNFEELIEYLNKQARPQIDPIIKESKRQGKKLIKKGLKVTFLTARAIYRTGKKVHKKYQQLNNSQRKKLKKGLVFGGGSLLIAGSMWHTFNSPNRLKESHTIQNKTENVQDTTKITQPIDTLQKIPTDVQPQKEQNKSKNNDSITQAYNITDKESFKKLYEAALPVFQLSLISTELIELSPYDDRHKGKPNTIGIGLYWFPVDGNPKTSEWILTKNYVQQHPNVKITGSKALTLTDAWCRNREGGRVYRTMYKKLKGATLTPIQYAMILNTTFNNEQLGFQLCDFVHDNYDDPLKCAIKLITLDPADENCVEGILKRHFDAACGYLYPDYIMEIPSFKMKEVVNSKGRKHTVTAVNQFSSEECLKARERILANPTSDNEFRNHADATIRWMCKGGKTVAQYTNEKVSEKDKIQSLMSFSLKSPTLFKKVQADDKYKQALEEYKQGHYEKALTGFKLLLVNGYNSADLHSDISITYYNLGRYEECIKECQTVLAMGEEQLYPQATYNAGKAYEALKNYERAQLNYNRSVIMAEKNDMPDTIKRVYINAVNRVTNIMSEKSNIMKPSTQNSR